MGLYEFLSVTITIIKKINKYQIQMKNLVILISLIVFLPFKGLTQNEPEKRYGWTLSAHTYTFKQFTFVQALDKADSCGLHSIEIFMGQEIGGGITEKMDYRMDNSLRKKIKQLIKERGIRLTAMGVVNGTTEEEWKQIFEFASKMGISIINSEPDKQFLPLVGKLASQHKIKVGIHNHPIPSQYWHPDSVLTAIAIANSPYVGACADIGHWLRSGLDPVSCLKLFKGKLFSLHFKDLIAKGKKTHDVHWGTGVANVPAIIKELKQQGFKGNFSAEYEYNWKNSAPDVAISVQNFRKILKDEK